MPSTYVTSTVKNEEDLERAMELIRMSHQHLRASRLSWQQRQR